ncbi:protein SODIUM POTASSIUM ROOT DEFECTIVE 2-like [Durio zibethinus]|uniref:Protein SODIUM POTASSIUM ROOT DEFECTIVE 2-like n=1 Tax=Durio zibethinus TaxID=66656 RepID=A0A6P5YP38_DURZI|nr:protein SODIUM POTASSIUM ROOT DEFECTIVE 2-like [Durio zibethinus]
MKRMDIFCASQASTAICLSMDQASSSCSSATTIQLGGRAIDRHNPIIRDAKRFTRTLPSNPCTSQPPPINPLPYHQLRKNEKRSSSKSNNHPTKKSSSAVSAKPNDHQKSSNKNSSLKPTDVVSRKSTSDIKAADTSGKTFAKAVDFVTPPGSSRYLLGDSALFDDYDPVWALVPAEAKKIQAIKQDQSIVSKPSSSSLSEKPSTHQVVVLKVSLHCKGCEGKVRKHLSRMEGVTSFSIDFAAKKVTIVGDVTPLGVLASVSKVKSAQFWTSAMSASSATPALASGNLATNK